jgi:hypothetical protein
MLIVSNSEQDEAEIEAKGKAEQAKWGERGTFFG